MARRRRRDDPVHRRRLPPAGRLARHGAGGRGSTPRRDRAGHHAPHARSQEVTPPTPFAQTCNIAYPRALLERVGGFDEALPLAAGEDTDLAIRAQAQGGQLVAAPEVLTYHAVEAVTLPARLRETWRWQHLAYIVGRHPQLREHMPLRLFWKPSHSPASAGIR